MTAAPHMAEALTLAANRLQRLAVKYPTGSREFIEACEWAAEARAVLAALPAPDEKDAEIARLREALENALERAAIRAGEALSECLQDDLAAFVGERVTPAILTSPPT